VLLVLFFRWGEWYLVVVTLVVVIVVVMAAAVCHVHRPKSLKKHPQWVTAALSDGVNVIPSMH